MKNILNFLIEVNKLKGRKRRGWLIHGIKNPETTAEHIFHLIMLIFILGRFKKIKLERALKIALIHDICEVYSPDITSYDAVAIKEKEKLTIKDLLKIQPKLGRPTTLQRKKIERVKQLSEMKAVEKLISKLPPDSKKEIKGLWLEYEDGLTSEAKFVKQADRVINFLQGMEYWKKYGRIQHVLWKKRIKEVIDDPILLEFLRKTEEKFQ